MSHKGKVVRWNSDKGFGFVMCNDFDKDIFCHHSSFGGGDLIEGRTVTFNVGDDRGGKKQCIDVEGDAVDNGGRRNSRDDRRRDSRDRDRRYRDDSRDRDRDRDRRYRDDSRDRRRRDDSRDSRDRRRYRDDSRDRRRRDSRDRY